MNTLDSAADLQTLVAVWLAMAALVLVRFTRPRQTVGLVLSYVLSLGALHWFASALYLLPWHDNLERDLSILGLRESVFAMVALWIGCEVGAYLRPVAQEASTAGGVTVSQRLVNLYMLTGAVMYGLLFTSVAAIPSAAAILSGGSTLMATGLSLKCWSARQSDGKRSSRAWLAAAFAFPVITIIAQGFIGYGFAALTMVLAFRTNWERLTLARVAFAFAVAFIGLSVYTTYMRDRGLIRDVVWSGGRVEDRARQLTDTLSSFEWFDFSNDAHLERVNRRLNQNYLVGAAVTRMNEGTVPFAKGSTFEDALMSLVPRAIWAGKTVAAGSGDLVSIYTGLRFAEGTSVGIGHVLEFYVNFGRAGIAVGFFLLGMLLLVADRQAAFFLGHGDTHRFLLWYLPALNLLQVGGSFAEATASAAAAFVLVHAIRWLAGHMGGPVSYPLATTMEREAAR